MIKGNKFSEVLFAHIGEKDIVECCANCGSKRINITQEQRRSADEAATLIITCTECKHVEVRDD